MPPALTVRAFAEMLELPMYQQLRILTEQKYPRRHPTPYRIPFYQPAIAAIRDFHASGGQRRVLHQAMNSIQGSTMVDAKKRNNTRVIRSFQRCGQIRRQLVIQPRRRTAVMFHGISLKYIPDLAGTERGRDKHIFYNVRQASVTPGIARTTLELAHWVLSSSGLHVPLSDIEFVDLADRGRVHRINRVRQQTIRRSTQNARAIVHLWQGI